MRLCSFAQGDASALGVVVGGGVVDLSRRIEGPAGGDLTALLATGDWQSRVATAAREAPDVALADLVLRKPLERPGKIVCVGVNYADRNAEYRDRSAAPAHPSLFVRFPASLVAHGEGLVRPPESDTLDYEGEIVLVVGRTGRRIREADAMDHVAGYTLANEGTIREWVRHGKFNVTQGKNWERSGALGPFFVAREAAGDGPFRLRTRVNGELRQDDSTARMAFPFARLIHYISTFTTLEPGDLVLTGTPTGAGARFDPPRYLRPGDRVEVEVDGIGTLSNPVVDEDEDRLSGAREDAGPAVAPRRRGSS